MTTAIFNLPPVWLASRSPRRRELLDQLGIRHQPLDIDTDESVLPGEAPSAYVTRIAREKALAGVRIMQQQALEPRPVLAADTSVILDQQILGKPGTAEVAREMLERLSNRTHDVMTAIAIATQEQILTSISVSQVRFARLSTAVIDAYINSGEPLDKAGGYAIQGAAAAFISHLSGSYSGVMGLPLHDVYRLLGQLGNPN